MFSAALLDCWRFGNNTWQLYSSPLAVYSSFLCCTFWSLSWLVDLFCVFGSWVASSTISRRQVVLFMPSAWRGLGSGRISFVQRLMVSFRCVSLFSLIVTIDLPSVYWIPVTWNVYVNGKTDKCYEALGYRLLPCHLGTLGYLAVEHFIHWNTLHLLNFDVGLLHILISMYGVLKRSK